ncbi:hypothetical protein KIPB_009675, partial [Kipferlia bialata]|eukprot:g9675.t1
MQYAELPDENVLYK